MGTDRRAEKEEAQALMRQTLLEFRKQYQRAAFLQKIQDGHLQVCFRQLINSAREFNRIGPNEQADAKMARGEIISRVSVMKPYQERNWREALEQFTERLLACVSFNNNYRFYGCV